MKEALRRMRQKWYYALLPLPMSLLIGAAAYSAANKDDPGPRLQYGGTSIELHYDAPGANITKVSVDGTPCIILSDQVTGGYAGNTPSLAFALSCNWGPR